MKLNKLREEMAQAFIDALKEDRIPWERGWQSQDRPRNAVSDYSYKGINNLWLSYIAGEKGYQDPRWCTFNQAQSQGWKVRKGEKGSRVEFWSLYDTENKRKVTQEEVKKIQEQLSAAEFQERIKPVSSVYTVFNAEQIDGVPELDKVKIPFSAEELISQRDVLLKNMNVDFHEGGDRAFYRPADDSITLPLAESFQDAYAYMSTFLHEAGHATGHESRLDRPVRNTFGSPEYAKEELRAEIASAFTGQALGIDAMSREHLDNHKAYIQSWIKTLENNPGELYSAIRDAEKISDYLIEKGEFDLDAKMQDLEPGRFVIDDKKMEVSRQLAGRLVNDGVGVSITEHERYYPDDTRYVGSLEKFLDHAGSPPLQNLHLSFGKEKSSYPTSGWGTYEVFQNEFKYRESYFPTVECTLLEHLGWKYDILPDEVTRIYTISEFDAMMKQGLNQEVEFTIHLENQSFKDILEKGDGSGGLLEFLEKKGYRKEFIDSLQEEMDVNTQVLDRIEYERRHHTVRKIDDRMMKISRPLAENLAEDGIYVYVKPEDRPGQTHGSRAADLQELQKLSDQASGEASLYVSSETLEYLEKYGCRKETMESLHKEMEQSLSASQFDPAAFVSEHQEKLDRFDGSQSTQIINLFGGPGSGKTTCAMSICSELKKLGYSAEYVQEYAKELVYEKNFDLLDGSEMHQFEILQEQMHRVDRLLGGDVDFIVCDAPIVLNGIYNQELTAEYSGMLQDLFAQYQNMSFFIERDVTSYQQEGRMQTFQESVEKDAEIRNMLDSYGISWDSCTHEMLDQIIHKAVEQHQQLVQEADRSPHNIETASQSDNLMKVSEQLAGRLLETGMDVYVKTGDPANREKFNKVADLKELSVLDQGSASLYVSQAAFEQREAFFPTVQCRLSESLAFEEGKTYTVSEFDSMMEQEDHLFLEKKFELLQKYKDFDGVAKAIVEEGLPGNSLGYMGYDKVDFTIQMKNQKIEERQDIGDGDGSLLEFLEKSGYKGIIESLQEEMNTHTEFLSYQEKLHDVWDNLDHPSGIKEGTFHLQEQNNTFRMSAKQGIPGRGPAKGVVPIGR